MTIQGISPGKNKDGELKMAPGASHTPGNHTPHIASMPQTLIRVSLIKKAATDQDHKGMRTQGIKMREGLVMIHTMAQKADPLIMRSSLRLRDQMRSRFLKSLKHRKTSLKLPLRVHLLRALA